jgi:hypothetical protein
LLANIMTKSWVWKFSRKSDHRLFYNFFSEILRIFVIWLDYYVVYLHPPLGIDAVRGEVLAFINCPSKWRGLYETFVMNYLQIYGCTHSFQVHFVSLEWHSGCFQSVIVEVPCNPKDALSNGCSWCCASKQSPVVTGCRNPNHYTLWRPLMC